MTAEDPIERLAREGRELAKGDHARSVRIQNNEERERDRERELKIAASVSRLARYGWFLLAVPLGVAVAVPTAIVVERIAPSNPDAENSPAVGFGVLLAFVPGIVLFYNRRKFARGAIEAERRWATSLPFTFHGYPAVLGGRTEGRCKLTFRFRETSPDDGTLEAVFRTIGARFKAGSSHEKCAEYVLDGGDSSYSTNTRLAAFVRRAIEVLLTLHEKFPVESATVSELE